jgi:integrase
VDAFTGLRRNEILALCWSDIDWFNKEIFVSRAISKAKADDGVHKWVWRMSPPKSPKSVRRAAMPENVLRLMAELKQIAPTAGGLVFPDPAAPQRSIDPDLFDSDIFGPVVVRARLAGVRFQLEASAKFEKSMQEAREKREPTGSAVVARDEKQQVRRPRKQAAN